MSYSLLLCRRPQHTAPRKHAGGMLMPACARWVGGVVGRGSVIYVRVLLQVAAAEQPVIWSAGRAGLS